LKIPPTGQPELRKWEKRFGGTVTVSLKRLYAASIAAGQDKKAENQPALLCSSMAASSHLSTPFYKLFQDFRKSKAAAFAGAKLRHEHRRPAGSFLRAGLQLAGPVGPFSFAPPACAGFAE